MNRSREEQPVTTEGPSLALLDSIEMIEIPAGEFLMGTSDEQVRQLVLQEDWAKEWWEQDLFQVEQPFHSLFMPAFKLGRFPVTNGQYHAFVWATGNSAPEHWLGFHCPEALQDHPVVGVSKADVQAYCRWLTDQTGVRFRLPTEAEWERAARGGDDRLFPWGTKFDPWRCNTIESGKKETTPVGNYSPGGDSPFGISGLAGNVWEWTASQFRPYPYQARDGREEEGDPSTIYVVRGGAWYYSRKLARCSSREGMLPSYSSAALGFRLACN